MRTWALANQKGGCGKTTTAVHLAAALALRDARVLLVDLDPQAHATLCLGVSVGRDPSVADVLVDEVPVERATREIRGKFGSFDLVPARIQLGEFEEGCERMLHPERVLTAALAGVRDAYDHVLIDCPPRADGVLTANAVRASDVVMLVVETGAFALQGALRARALITESVEPQFGLHGWSGPAAWRVLATMFDRRLRIAREMLVAMQARFGGDMFDTAIRNSASLREAAAFGVPAQDLEPNGRAAKDFDFLAREVEAFEPNIRAGVVPVREDELSVPLRDADPALEEYLPGRG